MRIEESLNVTFDESLPEPKSSPLVEDDKFNEPIVQDLNGSSSLQVNVSDEGYPKSLKEARGHPIKQVIGKARLETLPGKDYILLPFLTQDLPFFSSSKDSPNAGFKPTGEEEKKGAKHPENEDCEVPNTKETRVNQEQDKSVKSTNNINIVSSTVNTASIEDNVVDENIVYGCVDDLNMPNLEEIVYSDDDEDVDAKADMTNLDTHILVSPNPTTRIY
ncbi:hypothetical protein Tco_1336099 [Tanacetum coccineum]